MCAYMYSYTIRIITTYYEVCMYLFIYTRILCSDDFIVVFLILLVFTYHTMYFAP